jgi:hypothetical protein
MPRSAFVNSNPAVANLRNNNDVVILRLGLPEPGEYVIFGRVVLSNLDSDGQAASARCTLKDGADLSDGVNIRIPGDSSQTIHLQGTARVASPQIVDIRCSTFSGNASQSSLFAIPVDQLRFD